MIRRQTSGLSTLVAMLVFGLNLSACGYVDSRGRVDLVSLDVLIANAPQFAGQYVCTEGMHITGFEASGLSTSMVEKAGYPQLAEPVIWIEGAEMQSRADCKRTETNPPFEFCRAIVCGVFETGGGYGHGAGYAYQLRGRDAAARPNPAMSRSDQVPMEAATSLAPPFNGVAGSNS